MLNQTIFITEPNSSIRLKEIFDQLQHFRQRFTKIAAGGQRTCQTIQSRGTFFPATLGLFAFVQLGGQMSDDDGHHEVSAEHHEIFEPADRKSEAGRNEQKIPEQRTEGSEKKSWPSTQARAGY